MLIINMCYYFLLNITIDLLVFKYVIFIVIPYTIIDIPILPRDYIF